MFVDRAAKATASVLLLVLIAGAAGSTRITMLLACGAVVAWIASAKKLGAYSNGSLLEAPTFGVGPVEIE